MSTLQPYTTSTVPELTKREFYAAMAMQALIARGEPKENAAKMAVEHADYLATALAGQRPPSFAPGTGPGET